MSGKPKRKRKSAKSAKQELAERIAAVDRLYGFLPKPKRTASLADMQRGIEEGAAAWAGFKRRS
jgi:hypothetical protein